MEFDHKLLVDKGKFPITLIIITNMDKVKEIENVSSNFEKGKDTILTIKLAHN